MSLVFLNPILTIHLVSLGATQALAGYGFAVLALSFGVGAPLMGKACSILPSRLVMLGCILVEAIALLMLGGPKWMLGIHSLPLIFVGLALNGIAIAGICCSK